MKNPGYASEVRRSVGVALEAGRQQIRRLREPDAALLDNAQLLRERNRELKAYAHTIAHDLKDPLSVIIATSDAIFHISDLTDEELRAYLHQIRSTAYKMDDMIDNILLLSEVEEAYVPVGPLDMDVIVSHVETRLEYQIKERHARMRVPKTWPQAIGYAPWIEEVWANLISNALKYGGEPPLVEVGGFPRPDGLVRFWVRDNGMGISPETQASLFRPFTQLGSVRVSGHGLGLSIVRRIVHKLGGQVGVETAPGKGSLFFFTLPARI